MAAGGAPNRGGYGGSRGDGYGGGRGGDGRSGGYGSGGYGGSGGDNEPADPTGVYLRGIPASTTRDELQRLFEGYGTITDILIVPSRTHDTNTAYVDFEAESSAQKVGKAFMQRPLSGENRWSMRLMAVFLCVWSLPLKGLRCVGGI